MASEACDIPHKKHCPASIKARICSSLRIVQQKTGCSTSTLNVFLKHMHVFFKGCADVTAWEMPRVRARKQSPLKRCLHGCVDCNEYVYGPDSVETECPNCGDARYSNGKPKEVSLIKYSFFIYMYIMLVMQVCVFVYLCSYHDCYTGLLVLSDERTIKETDANR